MDGFGDYDIHQITEILSLVGFSSPPDWVKPYRVLSTGQKFRADIARAILTQDGLVVFDEFTSVVDRTVAQFASIALSKYLRQHDKRFIAVSCHSDIKRWLAPDWIYQPEIERFEWEVSPDRPSIDLDIFRVDRSAWRLFADHHYLSRRLHRASRCFAGFYQDRPICFIAWLPFIGYSNTKRIHRLVVLPDFQGCGIGTRFMNAVSSMVKAEGNRIRIGTAHPSLLAYLRRSDKWKLARTKKTVMNGGKKINRPAYQTSQSMRPLKSYEYVA